MNLELRAAVAREVMQLKVERVPKAWTSEDWLTSDYPTETDCMAVVNPDFTRGGPNPPAYVLPAYESDIRHAWEVVEKMAELLDGAPWLDRDESLGCDLAELLAMSAEEAAEAICLRALAAVRAKEQA